MQFEMYWNNTPVVIGDSREVFGKDDFAIGDTVASGIRQYEVVGLEELPGGAGLRVNVEAII